MNSADVNAEITVKVGEIITKAADIVNRMNAVAGDSNPRKDAYLIAFVGAVESELFKEKRKEGGLN